MRIKHLAVIPSHTEPHGGSTHPPMIVIVRPNANGDDEIFQLRWGIWEKIQSPPVS